MRKIGVSLSNNYIIQEQYIPLINKTYKPY
jgi:hypothetical protein